MTMHAYSSRRRTPKNTVGQALLEKLKSMLTGAGTLLAFVFAPIWNHPDRMKVVTRWLFTAFGVLVFLWLMFWLGQRPVFTIKQIQIESNTGEPLKHVSLPAIRSLVVGNLTGNFFSIRLDSARASFEAVPWVRKASVRRIWPNGLAVTIEEHEALGIWGNADEPTLINTHGELFVANHAEAEADGKLLHFNGPEGSNQDVMALYRQLNDWFKPWGVKASEVNLSNRYAWSAKLDNGMRFEFGRDLDQKDREQINARVERFFKIWPELQDKWTGKVETVDLRYPNGFAIRLGNGKSTDMASGDTDANEEVADKKTVAKPTDSIKRVSDKKSVKKAKSEKHQDKNGRKN